MMRDLYLNVGLGAPKLSPVTPATATPYARLTHLLTLLRAADVVSVDVRWGEKPVVAVHMRIFDTVSPGGWVSFLAGWVGQDAIAWECDDTAGLSGIGAHGMQWDDSKFWRPWARRDAYGGLVGKARTAEKIRQFGALYGSGAKVCPPEPRPLQAGDVVRVVDRDGLGEGQLLAPTYTVRDVSERLVYLSDDYSAIPGGWYPFRFERVVPPASTANPIRTEPVYGKPKTELPPAPRVIPVEYSGTTQDYVYRIQHPVHGKWLLNRSTPSVASWFNRDTAERAAVQLAREGTMDDPTRWVAL